MPWKKAGPMLERRRFIEEYLSGFYSITELAIRYGVSRRTLHKWLARHDGDGAEGLVDRSKAPLRSPQRTSDDVAARIVAFRKRFPFMGPRKIIARLAELHPELVWPAPSTAGDILARADLVSRRRRRNPPAHPLRARTTATARNDLMTIDYKGQFLLGNHRYCYPLTITDGHSRFLLGCQALSSTRVEEAKPIFTRIFKEYGLPNRIRTDNGVPFATNTLARLSRLSAWWVRLGVLPELIEPGKPQQNGRHERMHRTLKAETTRPPANSRVGQQRKFDRFRQEFNFERPHEALEMQTPDSCYTPSPRPMPDKLPSLAYPDRFEVRYVSANGGIRWNRQWVNVSVTCAGEYVGLEEIDDGIWNVYFGPLKLGRLLEQHMRIEDAYGRLKRHHL